ncbi:MAG: VOC family protein [Bacteroidetes bacterium]|nr:VOC family protein [Bacteroidota bacterium]
MTKQLWLNLPVKDLAAAKDFYTKLGFTFDSRRESPQSASMRVGNPGTIVMLFTEEAFQQVAGQAAADTRAGTEVLISIDAESREEVDNLARIAAEGGGVVFGAPTEIMGWMYACGFTDLEGHRWNVLFMDESRMPG